MVCAAYANHFRNSFQFDDAHAIVDNPSIRSLANVPRFFTDASTFSVLPANQAWRPLVSTSLALDYWFAGGLRPFAFHLSTFFWYLVQLSLMFFLFERLFDLALQDPGNRMLALLAAAWYGLNPACAETVNYIVQRGDLYSTLGTVAGLYLFVAHPRWRKYGVFLLPVAAAQLSKPPALVFPVLLIVYLALFETKPVAAILRASAPAFLLSAVFGVLHAKMTPSTYLGGASDAFAYRLTQPYVAWRYFLRFFLPVDLSADTDMTPWPRASDPHVLAGFLFLAAILGTAIFYSRNRRTAPLAFGLWWFVITLAPTSLFALAEVENDHRMFFPCVGLAMSVAWALGLLWRRQAAISTPAMRAALVAAGLVLLVAYSYGTHRRNAVWKDEASLWRDVTLKSPKNGRGLMNYGCTRMSAGDFRGALDYFNRARAYTPFYHLLEVNLAIANGQIGRDAEAEQHFQRAMALAPAEALPYFYYARWLDQHGRSLEALIRIQKSVALNPLNQEAQALLGKVQGHWNTDALAEAEKSVAANPGAEAYLNLSLRYHQAKRYQDSIRTANEALRLRSNFPEAYNNIAAGYEAMGRWDEAIQAARNSLSLRPDFQLAKNNLAWSESQKALAAARSSEK